MAVSTVTNKNMYKDYSVTITFDAGTPGSYVGVADIATSVAGYDIVAATPYAVVGSAAIHIYLIINVNGNTRIVYSRGSGGAYSNVVTIRVFYQKQ